MKFRFSLLSSRRPCRTLLAVILGVISTACSEQDPLTPGAVLTGLHPGGGAEMGAESVIRAKKVKNVFTSLVLSPASVAVEGGSSVQFTVAGTLSDGSSAIPVVTWSTNGGAVTASGYYTAPATAGTYRVIARQQQGGTLADTSEVLVTAAPVPPPPPEPPPPPPPPTTTTPGANECDSPQSGWIWCDDFEQNRLSSYFEVVDANGTFARASGVGHEGSWGMRAHFAAGSMGGGSLKLAFGRTPQAYVRPVDAGVADHREIYWRLYLKHAPGWTGGGGDKLSRLTILSSTNWAQAMIAHVWSGGANNNHLILDPASGTDTQGALKTTKYNDFANLRWLGQAHSATPIFDASHVGVWYCIESRVRLNDAGLSNGVFEMWINGALEAQRTGMNWIGSYSAYGLNALFIENFWNNGSPVAQDRYMDRVVVSTGRIGC